MPSHQSWSDFSSRETFCHPRGQPDDLAQVTRESGPSMRLPCSATSLTWMAWSGQPMSAKRPAERQRGSTDCVVIVGRLAGHEGADQRRERIQVPQYDERGCVRKQIGRSARRAQDAGTRMWRWGLGGSAFMCPTSLRVDSCVRRQIWLSPPDNASQLAQRLRKERKDLVAVSGRLSEHRPRTAQ
jgi:hypothetical protein